MVKWIEINLFQSLLLIVFVLLIHNWTHHKTADEEFCFSLRFLSLRFECMLFEQNETQEKTNKSFLFIINECSQLLQEFLFHFFSFLFYLCQGHYFFRLINIDEENQF